MLINLIKNELEMPNELAPNGILMNGMDTSINLSGSSITSFQDTYVGDSLQDLKPIAENCNCIGALISYDSTTQKYTLWNGDKNAEEYWDPHKYSDGSNYEPSDEYGTVIAVCAGQGLWPFVGGWYGLDATNISLTINNSQNTMKQGYMSWAPNGSTIYNTYISKMAKNLKGWNNTKHLFEHFGSEVKTWNHTPIAPGSTYSTWNDYYAALTPIWEYLVKSDFSTIGINKWELNNDGSVLTYGDLYIPSDTELKIIFRNVFDNNQEGEDSDTEDITEDSMYYTYYHNIGRLIGFVPDYSYWSSSQNPDYYNAFYVYSGSGTVDYDGKYFDFLSVACLHF